MQAFFSFVFLLVMIFFATPICKGQSYYFEHYQADDGLAHNAVTSIIQDRKGLIWIGTRSGLNRFDGYSFKTYKDKNHKFGNIGNNVITAIAEDKQGMLWLGTGIGIFRYDPYKELFRPLDNAPRAYISHLLVDNENNLWFSAHSFLYKYNQTEKRIKRFNIKASCIAIDSRRNLWVGDHDGMITVFNPQNKSVRKIRIVDEKIPAHLRSIRKIYPINDNKVLIGCFKMGLKSYDINTRKISTLFLRNSDNTDIYVRDIAAANDREYWVATESGVYIYDLLTNKSRNLRKRPGDPYSLGDNAVYTVCRDNQGDMWVGTFFGGLNYYSKENARFEKYYPLQGSNSISGEAVREICSDNQGNLWIGTEDAGLNKFNLKTKTFTNHASKLNGVSYPNIHGLFALKNELFIGPFLHGMEIMDLPTGKIKDRFKTIGDKNNEVSDFVHLIYLTRDSTLLVGTAYNGSGLFTYDRERKRFTRIKEIPYNSYVYDIKEDSKGNIWTASVSRGAFYYNPRTGRHGNIRFGDKLKDEIVNEYPVRGIQEDSNHTIWFTTEGGGLIRLSSNRKAIKKYTTKNGLPTNVLYRLLEDDSGHLWISSLKGLICFNMRSETFKVYTKSNGLITDQFNFNSAFKDSTGKMYFGSVKGMIAFDPKNFEQTDIEPPTYITGFQINNKEIVPNATNSPLNKSILYTDTITLAYDQNNFSIEFAALNYSSPKVTRYEFLMHGLDKAKTYLRSNRRAYFTDLSAGDYTFAVRAKSNLNSWTGKERRLFIRILPPFWKSRSAYLAYLLIIILTTSWTIRYYHRYLERKNLNKLQLFEHEKEKEVYQAKIEFFTNIAHEIQTPLTLILGPVEWMLKKEEQSPIKKNLLMVEKNARRLAELTSQLLDFRKTEMDQFGLNFVNTNINSLLTEQIAAFKQSANKAEIALDLDLPHGDIIAFADREALVKICSNLISNAMKYAASKAKVSLTLSDDLKETFTVRFCNDGKGIPDEFQHRIFEPFFRLHIKDKPGTGIGLSLAKSLTELHNGSLNLASGEMDNVVFELILPIHQKFEFELSSWKKIN